MDAARMSSASASGLDAKEGKGAESGGARLDVAPGRQAIASPATAPRHGLSGAGVHRSKPRAERRRCGATLPRSLETKSNHERGVWQQLI